MSAASKATLLSAPIELGGDWGESLPSAAQAVIARVREVSLSGLRLVSDRQPGKLRVDNHNAGPPAIWLHTDRPETAWVLVDITARDWSKLAYQFGHELGHVLCNSWQPDARPRPPCQWLEEAMVEAFSLRGLGRLAASWQEAPPFIRDEGFATSILQYRGRTLEHYKPAAAEGLAAWFRARRITLENGAAMEQAGPAICVILAELERDQACVEDLGALNRWPSRSGAPLDQYLSLWRASCGELGTNGMLPRRLAKLLEIA